MRAHDKKAESSESKMSSGTKDRGLFGFVQFLNECSFGQTLRMNKEM